MGYDRRRRGQPDRPAHRSGAQADRLFEFAAGALDHRAEESRAYVQRRGIAANRAYGDWQEMLAGETARADRVGLVTVATPNATPFRSPRRFLRLVLTFCAKSR